MNVRVSAQELTSAHDPRARHLIYNLDWSKKTKNDYSINDRITPKSSVTIRVTNFNFIRYDAVWSIETKEIPAYRYLEEQWTQVLAVGTNISGLVGGAKASERPNFLTQLQTWRDAIGNAETQLAEALGKVPMSVGLQNDEVATIKTQAATLSSLPKTLDALRQSVAALILDQRALVASTSATGFPTDPLKTANLVTSGAGTAGIVVPKAVPGGKQKSDTSAMNATLTTAPIAEAYYAQQLYDSELARQQVVVAKIQSFLTLAGDVVNGRPKDFPSQKSGTIVTTTVRPVPIVSTGQEARIASDAGATTVNYYVQSELPLSFHFGPAYTNIKDFDIEKVQRPNIGDVFQQTPTPSGGADLAAFLTYMLTPLEIPDYGAGFGLTIGTGVKNIGQRLYIGPTAKFNDRLFLTGGGFSKTVKQGDAANAVGSDLFTSIKNVRTWGWFVALTVSPF